MYIQTPICKADFPNDGHNIYITKVVYLTTTENFIWWHILLQPLPQLNVCCNNWAVSPICLWGFLPTPRCSPQPVERGWRNIWHVPPSSGLATTFRFNWGSGLWLGQSRVWIHHSLVVLLECFRSLSCCITYFWPSFSFLTDGRRFPSRTCW